MDTVSVIIPTHNRPHFLARAVESVLAQTYRNVEAVVVDDNMPGTPARESTEQVMCKFRDDPRVLYVLGDRPVGGGPARNRGIEAANGTYITFLDDDDIYLPEKVETQLRFMIDHDLQMSFTDVYLHDGSGRLVEYRRHSYVTDWSNAELMRQHILHSLGPTSTFMVRRDVVLAAGGFADVPMGQDFMLMWRMIEYGTKIGYLPVSHIVQYLHDGERISVGKNKFDGENRLYRLKQTKMDLLTEEERRYVDFRHYAVLSVTAKRSGMPKEFLRCGAHAVAISPKFFLEEARIMQQNRAQARRKKRTDESRLQEKPEEAKGSLNK